MRYASTIIYVADVNAALDFYGRAFGLQPGFADPGGSYGTLQGEGAQLAFARHDMAPDTERAAAPPAGFEVWIEADDVPAAYASAQEAGAEAVLDPVNKPWGQTVAYVRDPSGVLVEIGEPVPEG